MAETTPDPGNRPASPAVGKTLALAVLLAAVLLCSMEALARRSGYHPLAEDDPELWALARSRVRDDDPGQVVFLGASRTELGLESRSFAGSFGGDPPVQLAILSSSPVPVLQDLSRPDGFRGIVICEILAPALFRLDQAIVRAPAEECERVWRSRPATMLLERRLDLVVEQSFACLNSRFGPGAAIALLARRAEPVPAVVFGADRCRRVDFRSGGAKRRELGVGIYHDPVPWPAARLGECLDELEGSVTRIQERGGRVVFVVMPVTGALRDYEARVFPRDRYWDVLARTTRAIAIHFEDYPELSGFTTGDGSHLDYRDAELFSRALARIVRVKMTSTPRQDPNQHDESDREDGQHGQP